MQTANNLIRDQFLNEMEVLLYVSYTVMLEDKRNELELFLAQNLLKYPEITFYLQLVILHMEDELLPALLDFVNDQSSPVLSLIDDYEAAENSDMLISAALMDAAARMGTEQEYNAALMTIAQISKSEVRS